MPFPRTIVQSEHNPIHSQFELVSPVSFYYKDNLHYPPPAQITHITLFLAKRRGCAWSIMIFTNPCRCARICLEAQNLSPISTKEVKAAFAFRTEIPAQTTHSSHWTKHTAILLVERADLKPTLPNRLIFCLWTPRNHFFCVLLNTNDLLA